MKIKYDCLKCPGYCCSYSEIPTSDKDIERLAKHFNVSFEKARKKFTKKAVSNKGRILRHKHDHLFVSVCQFLDSETRNCTIYHARPKTCHNYPGVPRCEFYDFLQAERDRQEDPDLVISAYVADS